MIKNESLSGKILDNIGILVLLLDKKGNVKYINKKGAEKLGYRKEEIIGKNWIENFIPDREKALLKEVCSKVRNKNFQNFKNSVLTKNKRERVILWSNAILKNKKGQIKNIISSGIDITEQEDAEKKFKAITEAAQDAIILIDNQGKVSYWNKAAEKILGYKKEEILEKNLHQIITPKKYFSAYKKAFPHFQETGKGFAIGKTLKLEAKIKKGKIIPVELSLSSLKINNKWNAIGILRDISDKQKYQEKLKKQKETAEKYLELAGAMIVIVDTNGKIILINKKGYELLGYEKNSLKNKNWFDTCIPLELKEKLRKKFKEFIKHKGKTTKNKEYETYILTKNKKKKLILWESSFIKNEKGEITKIIFSGKDITERKKMEEKMKKKNEEFKKINEFAIDRELRMVELKKEVNELLEQLNKKPKYKIIN